MRARLTFAVGVALAASAAFAGAEGPSRPAALVVALDPGHGGSNLGAEAAGLYEKDLTLALARRVRARLEAAPGVRVVLCRDGDVFVPIRARARCAAEAGARLFLSLHVNAAPVGVAQGVQRGFELYVLPPEDVDDDAKLAALGAPGARGVWAAHLVHAAAARSSWPRALLERRLTEALGRPSARGIRQSGAALDVLRGTGGPGVLVEVGFLDHAEERAGLASPGGQERLAGALALAVLDFAGATAPERVADRVAAAAR